MEFQVPSPRLPLGTKLAFERIRLPACVRGSGCRARQSYIYDSRLRVTTDTSFVFLLCSYSPSMLCSLNTTMSRLAARHKPPPASPHRRMYRCLTRDKSRSGICRLFKQSIRRTHDEQWGISRSAEAPAGRGFWPCPTLRVFNV
jgi:hypothetical protein